MKDASYLLDPNRRKYNEFADIFRLIRLIQSAIHTALKKLTQILRKLAIRFIQELHALGNWMAPHLKAFCAQKKGKNYKDVSSKRSHNRRKWNRKWKAKNKSNR